uniref:Uncharacterized protein n=1 Tax=Meloidogyne incognita TaxID=6306 RepID=A0A914N4Y6_MELIC
MPQGVVYAADEEEEEKEEEEEGEEENKNNIIKYSNNLIQTSCMAAVCSGVSTSSSTPINCGNDSLFKEENNLTTNNSSTGNALQNLLTAGILPLANLTAQQILANALKGGGTTTGGGGGESTSSCNND